MTTFVSAGVYSVEKDLSQYVSDLSSTILGLVGTSEIGPTNTPVLITSPQEYKDIFGGISSKHYMGYAADAYLKKGNLLWVNRVSPSDASKAISAFLLPSGYSNYAGDWVLSAQTATDLTFTLSDSTGVTGADKVVKLDASTLIPGFDFTDSAQTAYANGKLGADLSTFVGNSAIVGNVFTVSLGSGRGTSASITSVINDGGSPAVTVPISAFASNNSPATAFATGSIVASAAAVTSTLTIGITADARPINIVASGVKNTAMVTSLKAFDFAVLETTLSTPLGTAPAALVGTLPLVAADASYNLELIAAWVACLLAACNSTANLAAHTSLTAWLTVVKYTLASGLFGIGSATGGVKSVTTLKDAASLVIEVQLESVVAGVNGISDYPSVGAGTGLVVVSQSISGKFTTSAYRPSWKMESAGAVFVPTVIKISSLGEADASNTAVTLTIDETNVTTQQEQNYTLKVYERIASTNIPSTSYRLADFQLVEQFDGTIASIQSKVVSASRRIALKIDYSTTDSVNITTGVVTPGVTTDSLVHTPVLITSETGIGAATCFTVTLGAGGYDMTLVNTLVGGSPGTVVNKYDIIGDAALRTGIYAFANPEMIDINVLSAPGWSADPAVAKAMTALAEFRGDAIALIDSPFGLSVQNVVDYRKNILNINSSYSAMYYPWVKITDAVNKKDIFVPPTGMVAAQYAYTDQVADVFYAPAGRTRGTLTEALAVERTLTQGQRDILALNQINPIHSEAGYGIYIKGQRTLQTATTALDRVNVRRLLLKLRKVVASASKSFEFEPGDSITAQKLKQVAETVLEDHLRRGAINSYTVDVGPNVNTPLVRENNELRMNISLVPTKTAEVIIETYLIQNQGGGISLV